MQDLNWLPYAEPRHCINANGRIRTHTPHHCEHICFQDSAVITISVRWLVSVVLLTPTYFYHCHASNRDSRMSRTLHTGFEPASRMNDRRISNPLQCLYGNAAYNKRTANLLTAALCLSLILSYDSIIT